jgi:hypothetical protein
MGEVTRPALTQEDRLAIGGLAPGALPAGSVMIQP